MKVRFLLPFAGTLLTILLIVPAAVGQENSDGLILKETTLEKTVYRGDTLYRYKGDILLSFGSSMDRSFESSERDFGARFSVVRITGETVEVLYQSRGSGDSYLLEPSFFSVDETQAPLIILAETGTEYSWGARVFLVWPDGKAEDAGSLDVAVSGGQGFEDQALSIIPHTRIKRVKDGFEFTFDRDVIFDPGGEDERPVKKDLIKYWYDGASRKLSKE